MGLKWTARLLALFIVVSVGAAQTVRAGGKRSDAVVKVAATATKIDAAGKQTVTVTLDVDKTWHIYANPVKDEMLVSSQTVVTVDAKTPPADVKVMYPAGKFHAKDKFYYYEGKVTIQAQVQRAAGDTSPLEVSVRISACDDHSCLLPATKKFMLP